MKKIAIACIAFALTLSYQLYGQDTADKAGKDSPDKKAEKIESPSNYTVYSEESLEDFESNQYTTEKNLEFKYTQYQEAGASIKGENPAPTGKSTKYLGVKFFGKSTGTTSDVLTIRPTKEIAIEKYCKQISIWVYGRKIAGELSMLIRDARDQNHRLVFGRLNFLGWRKLTVTLDKQIKQTDDFLNQKKLLKIIQFQYRPMNVTPLPMWHYFYIDDVTGLVREKYTDRQSDDW